MELDAGTVRILLLLGGIALVAGIYGWDRYKRISWRLRSVQQARARRQPRLGEEAEADSEPREGLTLPAEPEIEPDTLLLTEADTLLLDDEEDSVLGFSAVEAADHLHHNPDVPSGVPRKLLVINLVAKGEDFEGQDILRAVASVDLEPGPMDIFHRHDNRRPDMVLFSMASMVEPGSFPLENMQDFKTPGLTLFTQLPGVRDGVQIYSDMLFTAQRLLATLGGVLQDETHSVLTKQTIEHTRESILEHRRQLQLAMRR